LVAQEKFGKRKRNVMLDSIEEDCVKNEEGVRAAMQTSEELRRLMEVHLGNLKILSQSPEDLMKLLPSVSAVADPQDEALVQEIQRLLGKVDEMKEQRRQKEQELRQQVHADDITAALVTNRGVCQEVCYLFINWRVTCICLKWYNVQLLTETEL
jgi:tyrosine-protein phosphatase non-receptor type 23